MSIGSNLAVEDAESDFDHDCTNLIALKTA